MASRIEDYGLIGDMQTGALVSRTGSVDWLCVPNFDSDACFASLIGYDQHGRWSIRPTVPVRETHQTYVGDTVVLSTEFTCDGGVVRVVDFMPLNAGRSDLIRIVEGVSGTVPLEMIVAPRFGYGANRPWARASGGGTLFIAGPDAMRLETSLPTRIRDDAVEAYFPIAAGQHIAFQLAWFPSHRPAPLPLDPGTELERTLNFWRSWAARCTYKGRYREPVLRSLLTLKALTFAPTGAIVAAPTTSLPEEIGGVRNWDYRFCWLRDTSLTLQALLMGGYVDEAASFREWLMRSVAGAPEDVQIMYDIRGGRRLTEYELKWLPGYEGSRPVRLGNAASEQFQLDIFGEAMNALYMGRRHGIPEQLDGWPVGRRLIRHVERDWQRPDEGIWEVRGGQRHFTYSKVMAWVAIDRAVKLVEEFGAGGDEGKAMVPGLRALRERIHEEVCDRGFNPTVKAFTQYYGSHTLDASVLLIPHMGFLPPSDPRMRSTVEAIEKHLVEDGFVLRYATEEQVDGLAGSEGAFLACSFWLVDNLALAGRVEEAEELFDRLLSLRNHLGLLAEEYSPKLGAQLGNVPQGFSHLALIDSAHILELPEVRQHRGPSARQAAETSVAPPPA